MSRPTPPPAVSDEKTNPSLYTQVRKGRASRQKKIPLQVKANEKTPVYTKAPAYNEELSPVNEMISEKLSVYPVGYDSTISREQLRQLLSTVKAVRRGNFAVRMPIEEEGIIAEIGEVLNDIIELNENMANEF